MGALLLINIWKITIWIKDIQSQIASMTSFNIINTDHNTSTTFLLIARHIPLLRRRYFDRLLTLVGWLWDLFAKRTRLWLVGCLRRRRVLWNYWLCCIRRIVSLGGSSWGWVCVPIEATLLHLGAGYAHSKIFDAIIHFFTCFRTYFLSYITIFFSHLPNALRVHHSIAIRFVAQQ